MSNPYTKGSKHWYAYELCQYVPEGLLFSPENSTYHATLCMYKEDYDQAVTLVKMLQLDPRLVNHHHINTRTGIVHIIPLPKKHVQPFRNVLRNAKYMAKQAKENQNHDT